jgi:hypothetical protein
MAPQTGHSLIPIDKDDAVHAAVRTSAAEQAADGVDRLLDRGRQTFDRLRADIREVPLDAVVDFWGIPLRFDDFLRTRILELVVHTDDVAYSAGLPASGVSDDAIEVACSLGLAIVLRRYGPTPVLRALFRGDLHSREALRPF